MGNRSSLFVAGFVCTVGFFLVDSSPAFAEMPHVRVSDVWLSRALTEGYERCPTIRHLIERLQDSDVIVHIEPRAFGQRLAGATYFVARAGGYRYLRIHINATMPWNMTIALLGHELQHAIEIASAHVMTPEELERLYRRTDRSYVHASARSYDSAEARDVGDQVLSELRTFRSRRHQLSLP